MTDKDFDLFPSPCYIMEEELLRKNLELIKSVADRAGVEIILAFKSFAMWRSFPIFREYVEHSTASSVYEARLALEEFGSKAHTYSPAYHIQFIGSVPAFLSHDSGGRAGHILRHTRQPGIFGGGNRTVQPMRSRHPLRCDGRTTLRCAAAGN